MLLCPLAHLLGNSSQSELLQETGRALPPSVRTPHCFHRTAGSGKRPAAQGDFALSSLLPLCELLDSSSPPSPFFPCFLPATPSLVRGRGDLAVHLPAQSGRRGWRTPGAAGGTEVRLAGAGVMETEQMGAQMVWGLEEARLRGQD